jgi:hypothetical protein
MFSDLRTTKTSDEAALTSTDFNFSIQEGNSPINLQYTNSKQPFINNVESTTITESNEDIFSKEINDDGKDFPSRLIEERRSILSPVAPGNPN